MYSKFANKYLKNIKPGPAIFLKRLFSPARYYRSYVLGKIRYFLKKGNNPQNLIFISGLPKSGTTWLERMITGYTGHVQIMPFQANYFEISHKSSLQYKLSGKRVKRLNKGLFILKMHVNGNDNNVRILKENDLKFCLMYRDIRDAAVSFYFYVKNTPWHPEHQIYKDLTVKEGMGVFCNERLDEWTEWFSSWEKIWKDNECKVIRYEELIENTGEVFKEVLTHFKIVHNDERIDQIIRENSFSNIKKLDQDSANIKNGFFRKGIVGDWKNHFDEDIKNNFKVKAGKLLVLLGYERDLNW